MDKEFIHSIEDGKYYLVDFVKQKKLSTNSRGKIPTYYKPSVSGFANSKDRKMHIQYNNSISYTPLQNKYYGYCQCPMEKIKHNSQEKVSIIQEQKTRPFIQPINRANCFNKPKTPKLAFSVCFDSKKEKSKQGKQGSFQNNSNFLCGNLQDASQVYKQGSIECLNYRRGTKKIEKKVTILKENNDFRFTCRMLNDQKVRSPPYQVLQKYSIIDRINQQFEKYKAEKIAESVIKRIHPSQHVGSIPIRQSSLTYQSIDISLQQSIDSEKNRVYLSQR